MINSALIAVLFYFAPGGAVTMATINQSFVGPNYHHAAIVNQQCEEAKQRLITDLSSRGSSVKILSIHCANYPTK